MALIRLKSMHIRALPSGFRTVTMGEAQLLWDCLMYFLSKSQSIFLLHCLSELEEYCRDAEQLVGCPPCLI